jgi:hypothetical protein
VRPGPRSRAAARGRRSLLVLALGLAWAVHADGQAPPKRLTFDGQILVLAWQGGAPGEIAREYIPPAEKLESWTKLASIREYPQLDDPRAVAANLVRALKQQNPAAQSAMIENPATGEVIVDFVTWPADRAFVEFNVFKYARKPGGGLVAQQYALRDYQDTTGFLRSLRPVRERLVGLMAKEGLRPAPE